MIIEVFVMSLGKNIAKLRKEKGWTQSEFGEKLAPNEHKNLVMGQSIRWYSEEQESNCSFPHHRSTGRQSAVFPIS